MGDRGAPDPQACEAALGIYRAIAQAQSRWQEVAAAIAADATLPLEDLTPDQECAVMNLQLRRFTPQSRADVHAEIVRLEAELRRLRAGADGTEGTEGSGASADDPGADPPPRTVPDDARWFAYAPLSGQVFVPANASRSPARRGPLRDRHTIRLMNDYGTDWPLWTSPTVAAHDVAALLDDELSERLRRWARTFNGHYDPVEGWDDPGLAAEHRAEADRLLAALHAALPTPWQVRLQYWETNGTDG